MTSEVLRYPAGAGRTVWVRFGDAADGDLAVTAPADLLAERRAAIHSSRWTWLRQVHGAEVVVVTEPGEGAGAEADAAVTDRPMVPLAVHTADCAPVALWSDEGVIGAIHAGWRGLLVGVVANCCRHMHRLGAGDLFAAVGPCISAARYEFGRDELALLEQRFGPAVVGHTTEGGPALDLRAAVSAALRQQDVSLVEVSPVCTAESDRHFSHRARRDARRQATVVWLESSGPT
ncbi:MAG: hypothetical protein JJLCMIEE_01812 [Acidimicrobiales bacterium]|nr:MAG: laccase domain-containing protein [Actinomycetota bacterium]MBV6508746.1 hypothetical protein [Acidimicrobiales bacterium]RIK06517.1 MAG: hypothetical protein DCC48_06270 [Acidobacteriota bacterium]